MKKLVVIQARTGSSRLPGKVLLPLAGKPLLVRLHERVAASKSQFEIVVATTVTQSDDAIQDLCTQHRIRCFRGHPTDLLDRHYRAGLQAAADVVIKIPSDCPLIDPVVIDSVIKFFDDNAGTYDYVSNLHPPSYPDGNDVEVMSMHALELAWFAATRQHEREHTTPYIWDNPHRFRIGNVTWSTGMDFSRTHRWTIDYPEDYDLISEVYRRLWTPENAVFSLTDILALLEQDPVLTERNARYRGTF